jgi:C-5 cytosine-specific DNA methylase
LYGGLGGWAEGLLAEGWTVIGFDIERHCYGDEKYPGILVLQDVTTLHGSQLKDADLIVSSPPCQAYSYRAMPWKRAKALPPPDNTLFEACFRIQREACEAAGRYIPLIVENVRGAEKWIGRAKWHSGSMYFWGDVPTLMPVFKVKKQNGDSSWFYKNYEGSARRFSSHSKERRAWSAQIAKIPLPLAVHIARVFKPT